MRVVSKPVAPFVTHAFHDLPVTCAWCGKPAQRFTRLPVPRVPAVVVVRICPACTDLEVGGGGRDMRPDWCPILARF